MKIAAAIIPLFFAVSAFAAPAPAGKLGDTPDLQVSVKVASAAGNMSAKTRVQAQSQFSLKRVSKDPRQFVFSAVPVMNPNNGRVRMEFKLHAQWGKSGEEIELQSAVEFELGREIVIHDADDAVVRLLVVAAE